VDAPRENPGKRSKSSRWFWALSFFGRLASPFWAGKSGRKSPVIKATSFPLGGKNGPTGGDGVQGGGPLRQITFMVLAAVRLQPEIVLLTNGAQANLRGSRKSTSGLPQPSGSLPNLWTIFATLGIAKNSSAS
jgi:hypothetical protein